MILLGSKNLLKSGAILIRSRFEYIQIWSLFTAVVCIIAGKGFPPILPTLMSLFAIFFISASVYIYNDIIDREMDKQNPWKEDRLSTAWTVSQKDTMKLIYIFGLIGLVFTLFINIYSFICSFLFLLSFSVYSYPKIRLKTKFLGKDLNWFFGFLLCGLVGSYAIVGAPSLPVLFATITFAVWGLLVLPIIADATDVEEDTLHGVKSISVLLSWDRKVQLLISGFLFVMIMTPLTYARLGFNMLLPIFAVALSLLILILIYPKIVKFELSEYLKARKLGHIYWVLLEIIFIFGSINLNFNIFG